MKIDKFLTTYKVNWTIETLWSSSYKTESMK
jgi:hypothetical protein